MHKSFLFLVLFVPLILKAQDSLNISLVSRICYWDAAWGITVLDDYAYVADGFAGLRIVDISQPDSLIEVGFFHPPGKAVDIEISGNYAFVAFHSDWNSGLRIIDISDPTSPEQVSFYEDGYGNNIKVSGNYAYVSQAFAFKIVDISDPSSPEGLGEFEYDPANDIYDFTISENYAFLVRYHSADPDLLVLDISNPDSLYEVGSSIIQGRAVSIDIAGNYAYMGSTVEYEDSTRVYLNVIDIEDPASPVVVGSCPIQGDGRGSRVYVSGNHVFIGGAGFLGGAGFMSSVDISDPFSPFEICNIEIPYYVEDIDFQDDKLFIAASGSNLQIIEVSDDASLTEAGYYDQDPVYDVAVIGDYAYVAKRRSGLNVFDISDPASPFIVGIDSNIAYGIEIHDQYLYTHYSTCFRVFDISNPESPTETDTLQMHASILDITIANSLAFLVHSNIDYISLIDVSDPESTELMGSYDCPNELNGADVTDEFLFVAAGHAGLRIVDYSDPSSPLEIGHLDTLGYTKDVAIIDDYAFILSSTPIITLHIVDISDPESPIEIGNLGLGNPYGLHMKISAEGDHVFVIEEETGLHVINVSNPSSPELTGYYDTPGEALGIAVSDQYTFIADKYYFEIFDCSQALNVNEAIKSKLPSEYLIESFYPNPFNSTMNVSIGLPVSSKLNLTIFNIVGQEMAVLANEHYPIGYHQFTLNASGFTSGIYFINASVPGKMNVVRKIVLIR
ncbi:MAG: T9SS type A sorting domain-containing protein [Candidatus Electryonea clarkiae]|nr:T9SS type A sorting domain-containing protein [Candidatus Electryonea clarkiae]MDP8285051.1 T9SS type A sorting domain-containing protein [Candidatus Electryonea clarkiae]